MKHTGKRKKRVFQVVILVVVLLILQKAGRLIYREYQEYVSEQQIEAVMQEVSELTEEEKNLVSHRGKALRLMKEELKKL